MSSSLESENYALSRLNSLCIYIIINKYFIENVDIPQNAFTSSTSVSLFPITAKPPLPPSSSTPSLLSILSLSDAPFSSPFVVMITSFASSLSTTSTPRFLASFSTSSR